MHSDTPKKEREDNVDEMREVMQILELDDNHDDEEDLLLEEVNPIDMEMDYDDDEEDSDEEENKDDALLVFKRHREAVFGCSIHPILEIAATGGEDDVAYVWHIKTGELLFQIEHTDTVTEVSFSSNGTYLATGDMCGKIFVHKVAQVPNTTSPPPSNNNNDDMLASSTTTTHSIDEDAEIEGDGNDKTKAVVNSTLIVFKKVKEYDVGDLCWLRWHFAGHILFAGTGSGEVYVWHVTNNDTKIMPGANSACDRGQLSYDGKKMLCAYNDNTIKLWELRTCKAINTYANSKIQYTFFTPTTVAASADSPLFAVGDSIGNLAFFTYTECVGFVNIETSVERLEFAPPASGLKVCISVTLDGKITVWDCTRTVVMRCACDQPKRSGISCMTFLDDFTFVTCNLNGHIYGFDVRSGACKLSLFGHAEHVYEMSYSRKHNKMITSSEDKTARVFNIPDLTQ